MKPHSTTFLVIALLATRTASAQKPQPMPSHWIATWATSAQGPEPSQPPVDPAKLTDATVRQIVHVSAGGSTIRVHFSNAFGTQPLVIDAAHIAIPVAHTSAIDTTTDHALTFCGESAVTIPIGAEMLSDPLPVPLKPLSDLAITFHLPAAPSVQTAHPGSRATSFLAQGNHVTDATLSEAEAVVRWLQINEVDVLASPASSTVVALGDSITDGHGATTDANDRWPDVLAQRLQSSPATSNLAVANEGIGGNHLLTNGLGQSALERLDRDLLAVAAARYVIVFEAINDIGMLARAKAPTPEQHAALTLHLEQAYTQIIERAHAHGLKVIGATITPFVGGGYYAPTPADEAVRTALNDWIRHPGHFDAVIDFDKVIRDPANPTRMLPAFDSGDHLHPGPAGYKAMGNAIPLDLFR